MRIPTAPARLLLALALLTGAWGCERKPAAPAPRPSSPPAPIPLPAAPPVVPPAPVTRISVLGGTDTRAYLAEMAQAFQKQHPGYEVLLDHAGSLEAATRILEGRENPLMFLPADSRIVDLLIEDWQRKGDAPLFDHDGAGAPQSLFKSPLVLVAWDERGALLEKAGGGHVSWKTLRQAANAAHGWKSLGGDPAWGAFKLGLTNPTLSNTGMQALVSMAIEQQGGKGQLSATNLRAPALRGFIKDVTKAVPQFRPSTELMLAEMLRQGPASYDVAVMYESAAVSLQASVRKHWGKLRIYYLAPSLWSDHPIGLIRSGAMSPEEHTGALAFIALLRGTDGQERALLHGFRPNDPEVPLTALGPRNPFTRMADSGMSVAVPPPAAIPDGAVIRPLQALWTSLGLRTSSILK